MAGSVYDWSKTASSNATADGDVNWAEGQLPSTVNNSARQMMARVAEFMGDINGTLTAGGTADALTLTANSAFTAYANGRMLAFKASETNTGAATLNANAIGAKAIRKVGASGEAALAAGDIRDDGIFIVRYLTSANGGAGGWILLNPVTDGGTFQASDPTLVALAAFNTNGFLVQTATDTFAGRTITGTANEITVTNGNGVSGNPVLSLHSGIYRASGTDVAVADGGTGSSTAGGGRTYLGPFFKREVDTLLSNLSATKQGLDATLTAFAGLTFAAGGTFYATGADAFAVRTIGTVGQVWTVNGAGNAPEWQTPSAGNIGQHTIYIPAAAMVPATTNGASAEVFETTSNARMIAYLAYSPSTEEFAHFSIQMPKSWDEGTLIVQFVWTHPSTTTNFGVAWGMEATALANDDALDAAWGTEVATVDTGGTTHDVYISPESTAVTVAGSPAAEEWVSFRVTRVVGNGSDNMAVDAWLLGVKIHYTTNAATDD